MEKFQVEIRNNPVLKKLFLEHAINIGLKHKSNFDTQDVQSFQVGVYEDNYITYSSSGLFHKPDEFTVISIAEFLEMGASKTVKLNEKYNAIVTKDNIKVGCQDFDPKVLKELLTAWESLK